ncbi:MAG: DsbA family oxidoreductase [Cyclobacteriaceae bacterium]
MRKKIKIEVVSDVVCPWCYIGKRRLEKAMGEVSDQFEFEVSYLPFELNPDMPKEGKNQKEHLVSKFGGEDRYHQLTKHVSSVAAEEGLRFDLEKQNRTPNTRDAHRVIWFAKRFGKQEAVKEALLTAYFEKGIDLTRQENLIEMASQSGLDVERVKKLLDSEEGNVEVAYLEQINHQRKISGVPFYIINEKYGVSGAQPSEAFMNMFVQISSPQKGDA